MFTNKFTCSSDPRTGSISM